MNFGISWFPKTINYKNKKPLVIRKYLKKILFLILQVSDNNLFYLEAIHNFVEVSLDCHLAFGHVCVYKNLAITSKNNTCVNFKIC